MNPEALSAIESRLLAATPAPGRVAIADPARDPVDLYRENLSHGSGDVYGVMAPEHPGTVDGWAERPEHAVMVCLTGNGPTSRANAEFFAHAAEDVGALLAEVRRLNALIDRLPARWA